MYRLLVLGMFMAAGAIHAEDKLANDRPKEPVTPAVLKEIAHKLSGEAPIAGETTVQRQARMDRERELVSSLMGRIAKIIVTVSDVSKSRKEYTLASKYACLEKHMGNPHGGPPPSGFYVPSIHMEPCLNEAASVSAHIDDPSVVELRIGQRVEITGQICSIALRRLFPPIHRLNYAGDVYWEADISLRDAKWSKP